MATFTKHKTGWEYRYVYKDPYTKKKREKSQRGFARKEDAKQALDEFIRQLKAGIDVGDMRLRDYLDVWLKQYKEGVVRKNTIKSHTNSIETHIIPYFQQINLKEITPLSYQEFLNHLANKDYSKRTIKIVHSTMYEALEKAVDLGKIEKNPCRNPIIKGKEKPKNRAQFIDSDDIGKLLQAAYQYGYIYWIFFNAMIETGMRKGEVAALQWSDVDLKEATIRINKTLDFQPDNTDGLFGDTKTKDSERTIRISQSFSNVLKEHLKYQNRNKVNLNEMYKHEYNLVFCRDDGNFMPKSSLFNAFSRILKRADLPTVPIHSLRHSHAVVMIEAGADITYVSERLGHGGEEITKKVYLHVSNKIEKRSMDKYEERMSTILKAGE